MGGVGLGFGSAASQGPGQGTPAQGQLNTGAAAPAASRKPPAATVVDGSNPLGRGFVPSSASIPDFPVDDDVVEEVKPRVARPSAFSSKPSQKGEVQDQPQLVRRPHDGQDGLRGRHRSRQGSPGPERHHRGQSPAAESRSGAVKEKTDQEKKEEKRQARLRGEVVVDSDDEEKKRQAARRRRAAGRWPSQQRRSSSGASTPKRQKPKYMTMDEARKAAPGLHIPDAFTPILDLSGPDRKMLTSSSGLMTPTGGGQAAPESSEQADSRKLARRAQDGVHGHPRGMAEPPEPKGLRGTADAAGETGTGRAGKRPPRAQAMMSALAELSVRDSTEQTEQRWSRTVERLKLAMQTLPHASLAAMKDEVASITIAAIHPVFKQMLALWDPLETADPQIAADLDSLKGLLLLQEAKKHHRKSAATPYETMMYKIWLPHVSRAVREWNVGDCDQLLSLYEAGRLFCPTSCAGHVLEHDIVRKLDDALAKWEPKRRKHQSLPHLWAVPMASPTSRLPPRPQELDGPGGRGPSASSGSWWTSGNSTRALSRA